MANQVELSEVAFLEKQVGQTVTAVDQAHPWGNEKLRTVRGREDEL